MTVIRLPNDELFIHSPLPLTEPLRKDLVKLGTPRYIIGCDSNESAVFVKYQDTFPSVKIYGTPHLLRKRDAINFYGTLAVDESSGAAMTWPWSEQIEHCFIAGKQRGGKRNFEEVIFFHKLSHTVLVSDLFCHFTTGKSWLQKKARRFFAGENVLRLSRPTRRALNDPLSRQRAAVWLESCRPARIVMNHGEIFEDDHNVAALELSK